MQGAQKKKPQQKDPQQKTLNSRTETKGFERTHRDARKHRDAPKLNSRTKTLGERGRAGERSEEKDGRSGRRQKGKEGDGRVRMGKGGDVRSRVGREGGRKLKEQPVLAEEVLDLAVETGCRRLLDRERRPPYEPSAQIQSVSYGEEDTCKCLSHRQRCSGDETENDPKVKRRRIHA
jgi:hypothetical protein